MNQTLYGLVIWLRRAFTAVFLLLLTLGAIAASHEGIEQNSSFVCKVSPTGVAPRGTLDYEQIESLVLMFDAQKSVATFGEGRNRYELETIVFEPEYPRFFAADSTFEGGGLLTVRKAGDSDTVEITWTYHKGIIGYTWIGTCNRF